MIKKIEHIGIAVESPKKAMKFLKNYLVKHAINPNWLNLRE